MSWPLKRSRNPESAAGFRLAANYLSRMLSPIAACAAARPAGAHSLVALAAADGRRPRRQTSYRHAERAARHVVQTQLVAQVDGVRVAAVLAADADLQLRPRLAAFAHRHRHQPAHPVLVDGLEWVARQDLALEVLD